MQRQFADACHRRSESRGDELETEILEILRGSTHRHALLTAAVLRHIESVVGVDQILSDTGEDRTGLTMLQEEFLETVQSFNTHKQLGLNMRNDESAIRRSFHTMRSFIENWIAIPDDKAVDHSIQRILGPQIERIRRNPVDDSSSFHLQSEVIEPALSLSYKDGGVWRKKSVTGAAVSMERVGGETTYTIRLQAQEIQDYTVKQSQIEYVVPVDAASNSNQVSYLQRADMFTIVEQGLWKFMDDQHGKIIMQAESAARIKYKDHLQNVIQRSEA